MEYPRDTMMTDNADKPPTKKKNVVANLVRISGLRFGSMTIPRNSE